MVLDEGCEGGHKGGARVCGQDEDISFMPTWAMDWDICCDITTTSKHTAFSLSKLVLNRATAMF